MNETKLNQIKPNQRIKTTQKPPQQPSPQAKKGGLEYTLFILLHCPLLLFHFVLIQEFPYEQLNCTFM